MIDPEKESKALTTLLQLKNKNRLAVSFSGGKDSLVVLDIAQRAGIKKAVFCNTTIEFDETIEYTRKISNYFTLKMDFVEPQKSFFEMVEKIGVPSRRFRWCCDILKFAPLANYANDKHIKGFVTGLRRQESKRRKFYTENDKNPLMTTRQINPIIDWSTQDVWSYIRTYNLPYNPLYEKINRIGCWCCPYKSDSEWNLIREMIPNKMDMFEKCVSNYANQMKIYDKKRFLNGGWKAYAPPLKKIIASVFQSEPCQNPDVNHCNFFFRGQSEYQVERIVKILPIISDDYFYHGKKIRITLNDNNGTRVKLKILIEKAINCVGCGACTATCPTGALSIEDGTISVDESKCIHCGNCLHTKKVKGSCIMRNYNYRRQSVFEVKNI